MPNMLALGLALLLTAQPDSAPARRGTTGPAARGLDVYMFGPTTAPSGGSLPLEVVVLGFPTVTRPTPLSGAEVEVGWDPASVGADLPPVRARTDARGRALVHVAMPPGPPGSLSLLVVARGGGRERTRTLAVARTRERHLRVHLSEARVVPGSVTTVWLVAESAREGTPLPHAAVDVELLEGGHARWRQRTFTNASGTASVRVPIPRTNEIGWRWTLRATLPDGVRGADARAEATLAVREETPGRPTLWAAFDGARVAPGGRARLRVRALDAAGAPLGHAPIQYWVGSRGTEPKTDLAWLTASTATTTPVGGELQLNKEAPTIVGPSGNDLVLEARATIDGHALRARAQLPIGRLDPTLDLITEAAALVPGLPHRLLLRVLDAEHAGLRGRFELRGDGLSVSVETDAHGEAALTWQVPSGAGASHPNGSCAGSVAATVVVVPLGDAVEALGRSRFERCLPVDREAKHLLVADRPVVRAGDAVTLRVLGGQGRAFTALALDSGAALALATLEDGARGGVLRVPDSARGLLQISAAAAVPDGAAQVVSTALVVLPKVIPRITARLVGGRAAPGGVIEVEAQLTDEAGRPVAGTISGTVHDLHGGSATLTGLDAREQLVRGLYLGAGAEQRLSAFFDGDPARDPWRRAALGGQANAPLSPIADPSSDAEERMEAAFAAVVRSLEGALLEATRDPDRLADVRRRTPRGFELNPEMFTLVTGAMDTMPETPGGEPIVLDDLMILDPQVRFDRVARRIARLKLFWVLEAVRSFVYEHRLLPDELVLEAPDAILRRLVREGTIEASALLDPWGGTIGFVRGERTRVPYLSVIRGFELRSPGPDGRLGTPDDVRDPFERVLASGSPYARAVDEDRLVDARYEVVVGDDTVSAWKSMFETLTGTALGDGGSAMGMGGLGSRGYGSGGGGSSSSATGRVTSGVTSVTSRWIVPVRTDAAGRAVLRVPLGDIETTWRVTVVGTPDSGLAATTILDVPSFVPLSARVEAGAVWTHGDEVDVEVRVRNRREVAVAVQLEVGAAGALARVDAVTPQLVVPREGASVARVRVRATREGRGHIEVVTRADGIDVDRLRHTIEVRPAGTEEVRWTSAWIDGEGELELPPLGAGESPYGLASVTLTRGVRGIVQAALDALDPDSASGSVSNADALEAAQRVARWADGRLAGEEALGRRARDLASRALGRALQYRTMAASTGAPTERRLVSWWPAPVPGLEALSASACPDSARMGPSDVLELEPQPLSGVVLACWENAVSSAAQSITHGRRSDDLARAVIALSERPHRRELADNLAGLLRERGLAVLPESEHEARASRALLAAAQLARPRRAARGDDDARSSADDEAAAWSALARAQAPDGGFGTSAATRAVIATLLARAPAAPTTATVTVDAGGPFVLALPLGAEASTRVTLARATRSAAVTTAGGPVMARIALPILRDWRTPRSPLPGPVRVELTWPSGLRVGGVAALRCSVRHTLATAADIELRIPLPPGVSLAEGRAGLVQTQGVLVARIPFSPSAIPAQLDIPLRFGLAGRMSAPEAEARIVGLEGTRVPAPAAFLEVGVTDPGAPTVGL